MKMPSLLPTEESCTHPPSVNVGLKMAGNGKKSLLVSLLDDAPCNSFSIQFSICYSEVDFSQSILP